MNIIHFCSWPRHQPSDEHRLSKTSSYKISGNKQSDRDIGLVDPQPSSTFYGDHHQRIQDSSERKGEDIDDYVQKKTKFSERRRFL